MDKRIERLFQIAHFLIPSFFEVHRDRLDGRKGIYLMIHLRTKSFSQTKGEVVGYLSAEKQLEKKRFAKEKMTRGRINKEYTGFESAVPENGEFGGYIKPNDEMDISSSGFPPDLDQEFNILVSEMAGEMRVENYNKIKILSFKAVQKLRGE